MDIRTKIISLFVISFFFFSCTKEEILPDNVVNQQISGQFNGYKVGQFSKENEVNYWRDYGIVWDVISDHFLKRNDGWGITFPQLMIGDFNKDGWVDIFNPGVGKFDGKPFNDFAWLIWNPETKTFDKKNLFNDKSFTIFGGGQRKTLSVDLNNDGYTDNIIIDHGDDIVQSTPREPVRISLSDGKGGYDLKDMNIPSGSNFFHGGDIGDLDNDGKLDLVVVDPNRIYISWGNDSKEFFDYPTVYPEMGGSTWNLYIFDVDKDGKLDLIFGGNGTIKIFYNDGARRFTKKTQINFKSTILMNDFRVVDYNNDGLNDIVSTGSDNYDNFSMNLYIQNTKYNFTETFDKFTYTINSNRVTNQYGSSWKTWLILYDFNKDGVKDLSYIDPHGYWNNSTSRKSVFIRNGDKFIEEDFYQYDSYCKSLKK
jgi:hypothetical protein